MATTGRTGPSQPSSMLAPTLRYAGPERPSQVDIPRSGAPGGPLHRAAGMHPWVLPRKEVIQPQLPLRLPCYDFTPVTSPTFDGSLLAVGSPASGVAHSRGVTGGVYKARERIHRGMLIRDY